MRPFLSILVPENLTPNLFRNRIYVAGRARGVVGQKCVFPVRGELSLKSLWVVRSPV